MVILKIILPFFILLIFSCDDKYQTFDSKLVKADSKSSSSDTIISDSIQKFSFSRLRRPETQGLRASFIISPAQRFKQLYIVVNGKIRTNYAYSNSTISISAEDSLKNILIWRAIFLRYYYTEINEWCYFKDSIFLPNNFDGKYYSKISAFTLLGPSSSENFDIDQLNVEIKEKIN